MEDVLKYNWCVDNNFAVSFHTFHMGSDITVEHHGKTKVVLTEHGTSGVVIYDINDDKRNDLLSRLLHRNFDMLINARRVMEDNELVFFPSIFRIGINPAPKRVTFGVKTDTHYLTCTIDAPSQYNAIPSGESGHYAINRETNRGSFVATKLEWNEIVGERKDKCEILDKIGDKI